MNVNPKSIVISYNPQDHAFHRESLRQHAQGNALRLLKGHAVVYHAVAVVDTPDQADAAEANFKRLQRVAQGLDEPVLRVG